MRVKGHGIFLILGYCMKAEGTLSCFLGFCVFVGRQKLNPCFWDIRNRDSAGFFRNMGSVAALRNIKVFERVRR